MRKFKPGPMSTKYALVTLFLPALFFLASCGDTKPENIKPEDRASLNLAMGNPSNATKSLADDENYLIQLPQYTVSYSRSKGIPNWVSWHLSDDWLGNVDRTDAFQAYPDLPEGWYRVQPGDYAYAAYGFDRGHNCPSADRTLTMEDNVATFYMINMIPQAPKLNQNLWGNLESYCRKLVNEGNELYIITGNYGVGGTSLKGYREKLANGNVTVPGHLWKVILVLPKGENDLKRIDEKTRVIAIDVPNKDFVGEDNWWDYRVSVNEIEAKTTYDLFSAVPNSIQSVIEARVDNVQIP